MDRIKLQRLLGALLFVEGVLIYLLINIREYAVELDQAILSTWRNCLELASIKGEYITPCEEAARQVRASADYHAAIVGPFVEAFSVAFILWLIFELALYTSVAKHT